MKRLLVANRGEIARRIFRTANRLGIETVAVYSEVDADCLHVAEADHSVAIGPAAASASYLDTARILEAARESGADAVHPGYGFLSEDPGFARAVVDAGLIWVGPSPESIEIMADKVNARNIVSAAGVPVAAGSSQSVDDPDVALSTAESIGYPVIMKAVAGGGGIGMTIAWSADDVVAAFETASTRAARFFGAPSLLIEKYLPSARHVEVQVLGLADGTVVTLGERDCSVQRRHQKVVEESPAPHLLDTTRASLRRHATEVALAVDYRGAGTVEFLVSADADQQILFLEMNTRLQVEHPVTELVTGIDLVEQQILIAQDLAPTFDPEAVATRGHAIELRIYAEDPVRFLPRPGTITSWTEPDGDGVRVDSGYRSGDVVTPNYDPMLAKLCVWAPSRGEAVSRARDAVSAFAVEGIVTNLPFLARVLETDSFESGRYDTGIVADMGVASAR